MSLSTDRAGVSIDPGSEIPLYLQIAEAIRARIDSGDLSPGDALRPLREAAEHWGVNLHTVRHAYTALAREGLIETSRGARGTRVAPQPTTATSVRHRIDDAVDQLLEQARIEDVSVDALVARLRERAVTTGPGSQNDRQ